MITKFFTIFLVCLEVVILFNLLIIVHEFGHFLAARWRGLVIERFGIWFGKPIWKKTINGVEYSLGSIPGGGFVALPQMAPMEAIEGTNKTERAVLPPITPLDKIIVAFAGPLFSFSLAILFATAVWIIGRPVSASEITTTIGYVQKDSPASKAGLLPGDRILEVDGQPVKKFGGIGDTVTWRIVSSTGTTIRIKVQRGTEFKTVEVTPIREETPVWARRGLRQILIEPERIPMIAEVKKHSPAEAAGLKPNDEIIALNGEKIYSAAPLSDFIEANPGKPLNLTYLRKGVENTAAVMPEFPIGETKLRLGVVWDLTGRMDVIYPGPFEQVAASVNAMVSTFSALFSRKSDIGAQHLSGPVGIMRIYYILFESEQGWRMALWFSVLLNVNLALLNMLPIPVLDGGHITLAIVEWLRGKSISVKLLESVQGACAILLIGYMLYVTFYDVQDINLPWKQRPSEHPQEMRFAPKNG